VSFHPHRSEQSHLAAEAHHAGAALARLADLARILGEKPDGYILDNLEELGATLRGWAIRLAMAADDPALVEDLTGRRWRQLDPPDAT
jgi:hypothetical protein